jgi:hypothetical protein
MPEPPVDRLDRQAYKVLPKEHPQASGRARGPEMEGARFTLSIQKAPKAGLKMEQI